MEQSSGSTRCRACGFQADAFDAQDIAGTLRSLRTWWDMAARVSKPYNTTFQRPTNALVVAMMYDDQPMPIESSLDDLHAALHVLHELGRNHRANGAAAPTQTGSVHQISANDGGVPKLPIQQATIGIRGIEGDRQQERKHHGRLWQAICLQSLEAIERMQAEGHSIAPGSAGENITVLGVDWATIRPNTRIRVGEALLEISLPAIPCRHNAQWFSDGDFMRMHHTKHPAETRWYATVIDPGHVATGDEIVVEP